MLLTESGQAGGAPPQATGAAVDIAALLQQARVNLNDNLADEVEVEA